MLSAVIVLIVRAMPLPGQSKAGAQQSATPVTAS
jgi:hypothetical protein